MLRAALCLAAAVLAAAVLAQGAAGLPRADMAFTTIDRSGGSSSRITQQRTLAIRSTAKWKQVWRQLHGTRKKRPKIDFRRRTVVLVTQGRQPTGGYGIAVERVVLANGELTLHVAETEPGPGCITTQALTAPYHVIRIRRTDRPLAPVQRRLVTTECPPPAPSPQ